MSSSFMAQPSLFPDGLEGFVRSLYQQLLGREPDVDGWKFYVERLRQDMAVEDILHVFLTSEEHRARQRATAERMLAEERRFRAEDDAGESVFPSGYAPPGEAGRSYEHRRRNGFLDLYCAGSVILDVGFSGYDNPEKKTALPGAIGIDLDYPGYDGLHLPFADGSVDTIFSSHCLEHIDDAVAAIRDWHRVLKLNRFIVCIVPSQVLYEKRREMPSRFNADHKRMYTPSGLLASFEAALEPNSYRIRYLSENDRGFNYRLDPEVHSDGAYEIELVIEKIKPPDWALA